MSGDIVATLQDVGLTEYQSKAYVAAVRLGTADFGDLADESDIPQQRIYDVVDDLSKLGLVEVHEGSGGKEAVAIPPEVGLEELKQQRIDTFESRFDAAIGDLDEVFSEVDTSAGFVTVVDRESSARRHIANAIESAEWWLFLSLPAEWYRQFTDEIGAALDRGVTVRLLLQGEDEALVENTAYPDGLLVRYRQTADLVVAADREYGVFRGLSAPAVTRPSLIARDQSIVEMFQRYSEQFWTASRRVQTGNPHPRRYLTPWRAISDHEDLLASGTPVEVYVEGHDTETGQVDSWEGPIVDYELKAEREADYSVVLPEVARLFLETDEGRVSVGGWDATLEDVAAHGLEIRVEEA